MDASSPIAPLTFTTALPTTVNTGWDVIATIPVGSSILTAFEIPSETGLAILDGTTLTWRQYGITLSDGVAVSLGYDGLVDSTTTGYYETVTGLTTPVGSNPHPHFHLLPPSPTHPPPHHYRPIL